MQVPTLSVFFDKRKQNAILICAKVIRLKTILTLVIEYYTVEYSKNNLSITQFQNERNFFLQAFKFKFYYY